MRKTFRSVSDVYYDGKEGFSARGVGGANALCTDLLIYSKIIHKIFEKTEDNYFTDKTFPFV